MTDSSAAFETKIFTAADIRRQPELAHDISFLVNESFGEHETFEGGNRFEYDTQICDELGDDGFAVLMFNYQSDRPSPIAIACAKVPEDHLVDINDVNVATVAGMMVATLFASVLMTESIYR
jgi:hypothetical protein